MTARARTIHATGGELSTQALDGRARLELAPQVPAAPAELELGPGELLMTIEALAMVYGELCGASPDSVARGVNRTLRNRTESARRRGAGTPA